MTGVLVSGELWTWTRTKRGTPWEDTDGEKTAREDGARKWNYAPRVKEVPGTRSWKRLGRILPKRLWRKHGAAKTLILDF